MLAICSSHLCSHPSQNVIVHHYFNPLVIPSSSSCDQMISLFPLLLGFGIQLELIFAGILTNSSFLFSAVGAIDLCGIEWLPIYLTTRS